MIIFGNSYRKPAILGGVVTGVACHRPQIHGHDRPDASIPSPRPPRDGTPVAPIMLAYRCGGHAEGSRMDSRGNPLFTRTAFRCPVLPDIDIPQTLVVTTFSCSCRHGLRLLDQAVSSLKALDCANLSLNGGQNVAQPTMPNL